MKNLSELFPDLSIEQINKLNKLSDLYAEWNARINVISRKDIENFSINHLAHSLAIYNYIKFKDNSTIIDIGTGGGLPGIPLAIAFPNVNFHLVDSIKKKIKVVSEIKKELQLDNVFPIWDRIENVKVKADFIVSRAVAQTPVLLNWTKTSFVKQHNHEIKNGYLLLKGGDLETELKGIKKYEIKSLTDYYNDEFFLTKKLVYIPK